MARETLLFSPHNHFNVRKTCWPLVDNDALPFVSYMYSILQLLTFGKGWFFCIV